METHGYTPKELESIFRSIGAALASAPVPFFPRQDENELIEYIRYLRDATRNSEPVSSALNDMLNDSVKQPELVHILTDPIETMPLRINDEPLTLRTIAVWRLRNMR